MKRPEYPHTPILHPEKPNGQVDNSKAPLHRSRHICPVLHRYRSGIHPKGHAGAICRDDIHADVVTGSAIQNGSASVIYL